MIYRIADAADWQAALQSGFFASADLAAEGFIHCAGRHQVQGVADRHYAGRAGLTLLAIDEARLDVPLRRENTSGGTELFPHVHGPIPLAVVAAHAPLERDDAGIIRWPAGW
ncbi:MAG: DUF952 domain-containing protein [Limisphaerales bacterium]